MESKKLLSRVTGISVLVAGISWQPTKLDKDVARQVISYLEDRRALYDPYGVEVAELVVLSIVEIRRYLTELIVQGEISKELEGSLRWMRAACREFLEAVEPRRLRDGMHDHVFNQALGKLRGIVGLQLAGVAAKFELDVEDQLATILPPAPE